MESGLYFSNICWFCKPHFQARALPSATMWYVAAVCAAGALLTQPASESPATAPHYLSDAAADWTPTCRPSSDWVKKLLEAPLRGSIATA
ncbi:hypothetical protein DSL92_01435 [Billgrantia gudaonensis]|uniref:Uncharacterized protein n=1 Tax=Billgrantia gudaonensis TaxID=376427 RepID=A0A3S0Q1M4_9GAMM|nr:hypothetical protein DSL92_01435 [Halomonas gudaonensis]